MIEFIKEYCKHTHLCFVDTNKFCFPWTFYKDLQERKAWLESFEAQYGITIKSPLNRSHKVI